MIKSPLINLSAKNLARRDKISFGRAKQIIEAERKVDLAKKAKQSVEKSSEEKELLKRKIEKKARQKYNSNNEFIECFKCGEKLKQKVLNNHVSQSCEMKTVATPCITLADTNSAETIKKDISELFWACSDANENGIQSPGRINDVRRAAMILKDILKFWRSTNGLATWRVDDFFRYSVRFKISIFDGKIEKPNYLKIAANFSPTKKQCDEIWTVKEPDNLPKKKKIRIGGDAMYRAISGGHFEGSRRKH